MDKHFGEYFVFVSIRHRATMVREVLRYFTEVKVAIPQCNNTLYNTHVQSICVPMYQTVKVDLILTTLLVYRIYNIFLLKLSHICSGIKSASENSGKIR